MSKQSFRRKAGALVGAAALLTGQISLLPAQAASETPDFSALGAVGCLTQAQTQDAAERIYAAICSHASTISLSSDAETFIPASTEAMDSLMNVYVTVVAAFDEGILTEKNSIGYQLGSSRKVGSYMKTVAVYYVVDTKNISSTYNDMVAKMDAISAQVQDEWSDVEKALFLHEYLALHYDYDQEYDSYASEDEEYLCHTAYGMLTRGKAVCEGYAWLYNLLLHREGIESYIASSDSLGHAWNLVKIGGDWVHVDITWDDGYQEHPGLVTHTSFLKSNEAMKASQHTSDDWVISTGAAIADMDVTSRYDNGFWATSNAAIVPYQGQWLSITPDANNRGIGWFNLYTYDAAANTAACTQLLSLSQRWDVLDTNGYYYTDTYIVPAVRGDVLFYTTPTSIMALYQNEACWLLDLTAEQEAVGRIYGLTVEGDTLTYIVSASPTDAATAYSINLDDSALFYENGTPVDTGAAIPTTTTTTTTTASTTTTTTTKPTTSTTTTTTTTKKPTTSTTTTTTTTKPTTSTTTTTTTTKKPTTSTTTTTTTTKPTTSTTTTTTTKKPTTSTTTTTTTTKKPSATTTTTTATVPTETVTMPTEPLANGDADGDGELTVTDVIFITRHLLYGTPLTEAEARCADLLPDGEIDVFDLALMKRLLLQTGE